MQISGAAGYSAVKPSRAWYHALQLLSLCPFISFFNVIKCDLVNVIVRPFVNIEIEIDWHVLELPLT